MMSENKILEKNFLDTVYTELLSLEDIIEFIPVVGRAKKVKLMRTFYEIVSDFDSPLDVHSNNVTLPAFKEEKFHFQLVYVNLEGQKESGYFLLKALQDPFIINGNISYSSVLLKGDRVVLGHNILTCPIEEKWNIHSSQYEHKSISRLAQTDLSILIEGESGTGKTYLAKKIHEESKSRGQFVHLNLSSFSSNLLESEIFGHIKGAFTGAISDKRGAIKKSEFGTLFLDEIDSIHLDIQTKLLLFLDSQKFQAVGSDNVQQVSTRIIFASGRNLKKMVEDGKMRRDFYYRVSTGFAIQLNSLMESPDQIESICYEFCREHLLSIDRKLIDFYLSCPWPGNIRQLLGHLEKKRVLMTGKKLVFDEYDESLRFSMVNRLEQSIGDEQFFSFKELKNYYIWKAYHHCQGNLKKASKCLEMSTKTIKNVVESHQ
jgi:transcriptional regulator of acetoin/glycerol metabolism